MLAIGQWVLEMELMQVTHLLRKRPWVKIVKALREVVWSQGPGRLPQECYLSDAITEYVQMADLDGILDTKRVEVECQIALFHGSPAVVRHFAASLAER